MYQLGHGVGSNQRQSEISGGSQVWIPLKLDGTVQEQIKDSRSNYKNLKFSYFPRKKNMIFAILGSESISLFYRSF